MPKIDIRITNLPQIRAAFDKAPLTMSKNLNIAIRKAAISIQGKSMENTPVDTGRLRASHYTNFGHLRAEIGTDADYSIFVHEGTRFMKARPYLRQAVTTENESVQRAFKEAVDDTLATIARHV